MTLKPRSHDGYIWQRSVTSAYSPRFIKDKILQILESIRFPPTAFICDAIQEMNNNFHLHNRDLLHSHYLFLLEKQKSLGQLHISCSGIRFLGTESQWLSKNWHVYRTQSSAKWTSRAKGVAIFHLVPFRLCNYGHTFQFKQSSKCTLRVHNSERCAKNRSTSNTNSFFYRNHPDEFILIIQN
jgi:hypothetical protein